MKIISPFSYLHMQLSHEFGFTPQFKNSFKKQLKISNYWNLT